MQLTKIVATVGPEVLNDKGIELMIKSGVSVFRFNLKHNELSWHHDGIDLVKRVAADLKTPIATMIDLQGPSIRVKMPTEEIVLHEEEKIHFGQEIFEDDQVKGISVTHPEILDELEDGQEILAEDGRFRFTFKREGMETYVICHTNGILKQNKNMNIPGAEFSLSVLVEKDIKGIAMAATVKTDFVALSFVRSSEDIAELRDVMQKAGLEADVISKIEARSALDKIDEIIDASDGIMVARGDLGVEVPFEEVPYYQKMMIEKCIQKSKPVITATQMLNSMIEEPQPTRAEVSDVANAVYDLTDAVMLSGETAFGKYPFESIDAMRRVALYSESQRTSDIRTLFDLKIEDNEARICDMAYNLYQSFDKKQHDNFAGFLVFTKSGRTAKLMSRYRARPHVPVFAYTHTQAVRDKLAMSYGVYPLLMDNVRDEGDVQRVQVIEIVQTMKEERYVREDQYLIVLHGDIWAEEGGTSTVKLVKV